MTRFHRPSPPDPKDRLHAGYCLLSMLVPLAGLALYCKWHKTLPRRAQACGLTALVTVVVALLTSCLWIGMLLMLIGSIE